MHKHQHEIGQAGSQARGSLVNILVAALILGAAVNALVGLFFAVNLAEWSWWLGLILVVVVILVVTFGLITFDDYRIGRHERRISLLVTYAFYGSKPKAVIARRRSYRVTSILHEAWKTLHPQGHNINQIMGSGAVPRELIPEHFDLLRYALFRYLCEFGDLSSPGKNRHSFLRWSFPVVKRGKDQWPALLKQNRFLNVPLKAPEAITLPAGSRIEFFEEGDFLMRLRWQRWNVPASLSLLAPRLEVRVRWMGPLDRVKETEKEYEMMTHRAKQELPDAKFIVTRNRMIVEVESHWNFLSRVAELHDWGIEFGNYLQERMDFLFWWEYFLERTTADLDWKIGYIHRAVEPSLAARLKRLDNRLARLENHIWPDEPPEAGDGGGAGITS